MKTKRSRIGDFFTFGKHNPAYFVCSLIYYILASLLLGGKEVSFLIAFIFYAISMIAVFSPIGETVLRFLERVRRLETKREKEYLLPLFNEVCEEAQKVAPYMRDIQMCVIDNMTVNACALGTQTIAVTKGAIETFTEEELKAIIAHEIAHILYLDTIAALYVVVGGGFFSIFVVAAKLFMFFIENILYLHDDSRIIGFFFKLARWTFAFQISAFTFLMQFVLSRNSRSNEYRADRFAYHIGYGEDMTEALYLLEKISLGDNSSIIERLIASHPRITSRIEKVEELIDYGEYIS